MRMGPEVQMLHFAQKDMNLKRKLVEQSGNPDTALNENIAKVSCTLEVIVM